MTHRAGYAQLLKTPCLVWCASRWKVETYHKILKSGCNAEESWLRTADRLVDLIAVFCILSWRLFWMTMLNRSVSGMPGGGAEGNRHKPRRFR